MLSVELDNEVAQLKQLLGDACGPGRLRTQAGALSRHASTRSWLTVQPRWRIIQRRHHQYTHRGSQKMPVFKLSTIKTN